jgi:hypothetical protein
MSSRNPHPFCVAALLGFSYCAALPVTSLSIRSDQAGHGRVSQESKWTAHASKKAIFHPASGYLALPGIHLPPLGAKGPWGTPQGPIGSIASFTDGEEPEVVGTEDDPEPALASVLTAAPMVPEPSTLMWFAVLVGMVMLPKSLSKPRR